MSNLTVSVDEALIKRARIRAIQQGTSLSAKVREFLQQYADDSDDGLKKQREQATATLMQAMQAATLQTQASPLPATPGKAQKRSLRDELYQDGFRARDAQAASAGAAKR